MSDADDIKKVLEEEANNQDDKDCYDLCECGD